MGFLSVNFQLAKPFRSRLQVRHGQTDEQTDDGHQCLTLPPCRNGPTLINQSRKLLSNRIAGITMLKMGRGNLAGAALHVTRGSSKNVKLYKRRN